MTKSKTKWSAILALIFGILVIIKPDLLSYVVGLYLIITGVLGLMDN